MKIHEYNEMMAYLLRPASLEEKLKEIDEKYPGSVKPANELPPVQDPFKDFEDRNPRENAAQGGVIGEDGMFKGEDMGTREGFAELNQHGGKRTGSGRPTQYTWKKVTEDPLFEQFFKEEISIANNPSLAPKKYKAGEVFYKDLKKIINKYKTNNPEEIYTKLVEESSDTESIQKRPDIEKNKGRTALLDNRNHVGNSLRKFNIVFKTDVSPTGQKLLSIDEFAEKIGYSKKQLTKVLSGRFGDFPEPAERFTQKGIQQSTNIQMYNKFAKALEDEGIKITFPKDTERLEKYGSRGKTGTKKRGAGKIRFEANAEQIENFKLPFAKKGIFDTEDYGSRRKDMYSSLSIESEEYKKYGYSRDRSAVKNLKAALNNSLRAMSTDELVKFINKNPKLKHIVEMTFNPNTLQFEKAPVEDLAKSGTLDRFKQQGFFEVDHIRGRATVDYDPATKKILDGLNLEYPKNLTIIPKGLNISTKQLVENFVAANPNSPAIANIDKTFKDAGITYWDRVKNKYRGADPKLSSIGTSHLGLEEELEKILLNKKTFIDKNGFERFVVSDGERLLANIKEIAELRGEKIKPGMLEQAVSFLGKGGTKGKAAAAFITGVVGYNFGEDFLKGTGIVDREYEQTASAGDTPIVEKGFSTGEKLAGAGVAGGAYAARKPILKTLGKTANVAFGPVGVAGLNYALGVDPKETIDRVGLEAEAALAPSIVRGATSITDKIKNPLARKTAELLTTISPKYAMRAARIASPLGIASLGLEGLYKLGKEAVSEQDRINEMRLNEPEKYQEFLDELESYEDFSA